MQQVVAEAMAAGAVGFATSSSRDAQRRRRPAGAVARSPTSPSSTRCSSRCATPARASSRCCPGEKIKHADVFELQRRDRSPAHVDRAAHGQGLPVAREDHRGERRGPRRGRRGVAAGVVPAARVPDEPARAVHVQHARPRSPELMDRARSRSASPRTAIRRGGRGRWDELQARGVPAARTGTSLAVAESADAPRARRPQRSPTSPRSAACTPLDVMLDISLDENLETRFRSRARQQRSRRDRWLLAAGRRAARPRRLRCARQPALRRVLRRPTCSATGCASRRSCRSSGRSTSSPASRPAVFGLDRPRRRVEGGHGRRHRRVRPRHGRARAAAPDPRLPRRRRAPHRRRAGRHAPRARQRHADPGRRHDIDAARDARPGRMLRS